MNVVTLIIAYVIAINLIGFFLMGIDKRKAIKRAFRIPEATLFLIAILGGSIGSILGMYTFRHKTKHLSFVIGIPLITVVEYGLLVFALIRFAV